MKYPIILKYEYTYICSGNFYKPANLKYYELFKENLESVMVSLEDPTDIKIKVLDYKEDQITYEYSYYRYLNPDKHNSDGETVTVNGTLKRGEKGSIICSQTYWNYARGAENSPAVLNFEWLSYDDFMAEIFDDAKENKYKTIELAGFLIKEGIYDLAFNMLKDTNEQSYYLGLCYENGYGTEVDLEKALDIYYECSGYDVKCGIERVYEKQGKKRKFDDVKKTIYYESRGKYKKAYGASVIPTEMSDNTKEDMRRNVELSVVAFLELGRPFNDPFNHHTEDMSKLAMYYDCINNVPEEKKPKYHTVEWEPDPYDGGEFRHDIYHDDLIVETLQREASKNDVIALAVLLIQYGIHPSTANFSSYLINNLDEIINRLNDVSKGINIKDSGLAHYFLGLYYERIANKASENCDNKYVIEDKKYTYDGDNIELELEDFIVEQNINKKDSLPLMIDELDSHYNFLRRIDDSTFEQKETLRKLENFIIYLYNKKNEHFTKIFEDNLTIAKKHFKLSVSKGCHISITHIAEDIVNQDPENALDILEKHEEFIPYIRYSKTEKYFKLLKELRK